MLADALLPVREVATDDREVERAQDRLLRLALEQERERAPDEVGRIGAPGSSRARSAAATETSWLGRRAALADLDAAASSRAPTGPHRTSISAISLPLAARAPEREPRELRSLAPPRDRRPAAAARPAGPVVDPQRRPAAARVARRSSPARDPRRRSALASRSRRAVATSRDERRVGQLADAGPRVDPLDEQDLALVDVADPGQRPLVEQRLADRPSPARAGSRSRRSASAAAGLEVRRRAGPGRGAPAPDGAPRLASRTARRPGRRSRPRRRPGPRGRAAPGPAAGASARPAGSDATSRSSGGGSAARGRCRTGSGGSCRAASTPVTVAPDDAADLRHGARAARPGPR